MGRDEQDSSTVINRSSIALLQERFRQLERVKEMREQREHMRLLAEPKHEQHDLHLNLTNPTTNMHYYDQQPSRLFFHSELVFQPRSPPQVSLSIWPPSHSKHAGYTTESSGAATLSLRSSWLPNDHTPSSVLTSLNSFKDSDSDSDVDTSLHL